jgi:hypothetical protein
LIQLAQPLVYVTNLSLWYEQVTAGTLACADLTAALLALA